MHDEDKTAFEPALEPDPEESPEQAAVPAPRKTSSGDGMSWLVPAVGVLLLAVAALFLVIQVRDYRHDQHRADQRDNAQKVAEQFALRMDNFKGTDMSAYEKSVSALLSSTAKQQFDQSFPAFKQAYQVGKAVGTGKVRASGVESFDGTSATIMVIHDRLVKSKLGNTQQYLRWEVTMQKIDGRWLVGKFESVS